MQYIKSERSRLPELSNDVLGPAELLPNKSAHVIRFELDRWNIRSAGYECNGTAEKVDTSLMEAIAS